MFLLANGPALRPSAAGTALESAEYNVDLKLNPATNVWVNCKKGKHYYHGGTGLAESSVSRSYGRGGWWIDMEGVCIPGNAHTLRASWRDMLLTQPPVTILCIWNPSSGNLGSIWNHTGLSFGDLHETQIQIGQRLRSCGSRGCYLLFSLRLAWDDGAETQMCIENCSAQKDDEGHCDCLRSLLPS